MQYTDQAKIEAYLDRVLTANEETLLDYLIDHISQFISDYTGRAWLSLDEDELPEAAVRLYDGNGRKELFIDDFSDLVEIKLLDSQGDEVVEITDSDEYILYPLNLDIKDSVYLRNYIFADGPARVSIEAVFSSGAVPNAVIMVATSLCGKFISQSAPSALGFKSESIEGYSYQLLDSSQVDKETQDLLITLDGLKKVSL